MSVITMRMNAVSWNEAVSAQANSRSEVKRSGRSQNPEGSEGLASMSVITMQARLIGASKWQLLKELHANSLCLCVSVVNGFLAVKKGLPA